jgi:FtsH-binding integral membrane protein
VNPLAIVGAGLAAYGVYAKSDMVAYAGILVLLLFGCDSGSLLSGIGSSTGLQIE